MIVTSPRNACGTKAKGDRRTDRRTMGKMITKWRFVSKMYSLDGEYFQNSPYH